MFFEKPLALRANMSVNFCGTLLQKCTINQHANIQGGTIPTSDSKRISTFFTEIRSGIIHSCAIYGKTGGDTAIMPTV